MGHYDAQQVCLNGHQITDNYYSRPQHRREYCDRCGAKTIYRCPNCNTEIPGAYHVEHVAVLSTHSVSVPAYCQGCGLSFPWKKTEEQLASPFELSPIQVIENIFLRFHLVARQLRVRRDGRPTLLIQDEYDVQDLLHALLRLNLDDIRPEEYTPTYAGRCSRIDFLLKGEKIVIETKMTRKGLTAKEVGEQLIIDKARYEQHEDCKVLLCFVYDPEELIVNPRGLENDLSCELENFQVKVYIVPKRE